MELVLQLVLQLEVLLELMLQLEVLECCKMKTGIAVEEKTWTLSHKAVFGLCWFSWTRAVIFVARPSPDFSSLATSSRTLSPCTPFLPFAFDYWTLIQKAIFGLCPLC